MKVTVEKNETPFERMKRQGFEWIERYGKTAPTIIHLALEKLQSTEPIEGEQEREKETWFDKEGWTWEEQGATQSVVNSELSDEDVDDLEDHEIHNDINEDKRNGTLIN